MKAKFLVIILHFLIFVPTAFTQTEKARQVDEFSRIPCGEFMARMAGIFIESQNSPDSKIHVIYYGSRFRKENIWNRKTRKHDKVKLNFPHRDDGLNWAKSIPLYLTSGDTAETKAVKLPEDKFVLVNGGFRENIEVEIWLVPKNAEFPKPTPTVIEKDIRFRKDKPFVTPHYSSCYAGI